VPHGILEVFNAILYENEFQNPQIFHQRVRFSPERSTLEVTGLQKDSILKRSGFFIDKYAKIKAGLQVKPK
jgi:hypothetical protein